MQKNTLVITKKRRELSLCNSKKGDFGPFRNDTEVVPYDYLVQL